MKHRSELTKAKLTQERIDFAYKMYDDVGGVDFMKRKKFIFFTLYVRTIYPRFWQLRVFDIPILTYINPYIK